MRWEGRGVGCPVAHVSIRHAYCFTAGMQPPTTKSELSASRPDGETPLARPAAGALLPTVLSMTAGAVDVICFLGLNGLFTAHITGNLVVLAAHYVTGGFSQIGPLLSVPVFVIVLALVTFVAKTAEPTTASRRRTLLFLQTLSAFPAYAISPLFLASRQRAIRIFPAAQRATRRGPRTQAGR